MDILKGTCTDLKMVKSTKRRSLCFPSTGWISCISTYENGQISTNKEEEEVDVSQAQDGYIYILKDEV